MAIFHITERTTWETAISAGAYKTASLESEGFIHCSLREQVVATANRYYQGVTGLVLLAIDEGAVSAEIRHDPTPYPPHTLYPHIYGALNPNAVVAVYDFVPQSDGQFQLPPPLLDTKSE